MRVLILLAAMAIGCNFSLVHVASFSASNTPPPPPNQTPDERQAAMLQKMGYKWNGKAWVRGDVEAYKAQRALARSSNRFIRLVDANQEQVSSPEAVAACKRFQEVLNKARQDAMPERTNEQLARDRDFKNFLQKKEAPFVWLGAQTLCFAALSQASIGLPSGSVSVNWTAEIQHFVSDPILIALLGVVAGVVLAACRATSRRIVPGAEEFDGKMERILADAMDGNFALPAPNHIRYSSGNWKLFSTLGESIAAVNVSMLMNGLIQPALIRLSSDSAMWKLVSATSDSPVGQYVAVLGAWGAAFVVAIPAALRATQVASSEPLDGILAECEAALRSKQTAGAYFNMNPPMDANPIETTATYQLLVDGWTIAFGEITKGAVWKQPQLAYVGSLACAFAWQLSGGSLVTPCLARTLASTITYAVLDEEESCRVSVSLPNSTGESDP